MNNRLIVYQSKNMGSNAASVEQTKKMCAAFSKFFKEVILYSNWYGIDLKHTSNYSEFNLASAYLPNNSPILKRMYFVLRYYKNRESTDVIFSRDLPVCIILAFLGHSVIWENHRFLSKRRSHTLFWLQKIKYIQKKLNVINTSCVVERYFNIYLSNINSKYIFHGVSNEILRKKNSFRRDVASYTFPKRYILYWGAVSDIKGIRELLDWYLKINAGELVDLLIVGTNENFVDPKISGVTFLKRMEQHRLQIYIRHAELAVICSKIEYLRMTGAVPLKLFEAISLNKKMVIFEDTLKYEIPHFARPNCFLSSKITNVSELNKIVDLTPSNLRFQNHFSYDSRAIQILEALGLKG